MKNTSQRKELLAGAWFWLRLVAVVARSQPVFAENLLNDNPTYSSFNLELRTYASLPLGNTSIISMTTRLGDPRLYVATEQGSIYTINTDAVGNTTPVPWFNVASAETSLSHPLDGSNSQEGLQSIAFHPDFDRVGLPGYGKLYTTMLEQRPTDSAGHNYLGNSSHGDGVTADGVLAEWTFNHETGQVDTNSYRELFRVNMPKYDHPIKLAQFDPYARPGDEDYGLLYLTHGDSNEKESAFDDPQHLDNALGKMLRINPLPSGSSRYTIPASNPFASAGDPSVLKEIYAYGLRNPHTYSFNPDDAGQIHILVGDIGRNNIEEVNLVTAGENYGWPKREGTFVHLQRPNGDPNAGYITGVAPLPANEATFGYVFPVAQYDHDTTLNSTFSSSAIASGFVIRNHSDPNLHNQFIFNDFAGHDGFVYHTDFEEMLAAATHLDQNDPAHDMPNELSQAVLHKLHLAFDHDNNPNTPSQIYDDFLSMLNAPRSDTRYGEGVFGEMYISSKDTGKIYLVTNSVPLFGDYNANGVVDAADYAVWRDSLGAEGYHLAADGNGNGQVDAADFDMWRSHFGEIWTGTGSGAAVNFSASSPIPEPSSMGIIGGCVIALVTACRLRLRWTY